MKPSLITLIASALIAAATTSHAAESCPADWPVTAVEGRNDISLRVEGSMIHNEDMVGGATLQFSSEYSRYAQINGDLVTGFFYNPATKAESWLSIGKIVETKALSDRRCHKIEIDEQIDFNEVTESIKDSCFPLPSWMCGRTTHHSLELSTRHNGELFRLKSLTSLSR